MDLFLKIVFVIVVIILVALILLPCREYFTDVATVLGNKSTIRYSVSDQNTYNAYLQNSLGADNNDLLIMFRCIEFAKGGIEKVIKSLNDKGRFFISMKHEVEYTNFSDIEAKIESVISNIHKNFKETNAKEIKLKGPIFLLITQYPVYTSMSKNFYNGNCEVKNQSSPLQISYSPIVQTVDEGCINDTPVNTIKCEFYILMPSHKKGGVHREADIAEDMSDLLIGNINKNINIKNVRSKDRQCFTTCGNNQVDGYACGARNRTELGGTEVYNTPTNTNMLPKVFSDYANLYILNTNGINLLLKTTYPGTEIVENGPSLSQMFAKKPMITEGFNGGLADTLGVSSYPPATPITYSESTALDNDGKIGYISLAEKNAETALINMSPDDITCYMDRYPTILTREDAQLDWKDKVLKNIYNQFIKGCEAGQLERINTKKGPGLNAESAVPSAKYLVDQGITENGVYWIRLPEVGIQQVYCILDPRFDGGGWMLAMKGGPNSTTFKYDSTHWTTATTLNFENPSTEAGDAKYDVFNHYAATDWFAGFPDVYVPENPTKVPTDTHTGDLPRGTYNGYTWIEKNVWTIPEKDTNMVLPKTLLQVFSSGTRITKMKNPPGVTSTTLPKFNGNVWSSQNSFQFYGMNYKGGHNYKSRWGFGWNENYPVTNEGSNDAGGGIGTQAYSAGDHSPGRWGKTGMNSSMRFEFYVR